MSSRLRGVIAFLAVAILFCQPAQVDAHPQLIGLWIANEPPGGIQVYDLGCGEYIGNGIWRGPFLYIVSGKIVEKGMWELRFFTGNDATLSIQSPMSGGARVGLVDFGARTFSFKNVNFRK